MSIAVSFESPGAREITGRGLILSLMNAIGTRQMTAAQFVAAGNAFGIEDSAMRMAATRLTKEGLLESAGRGLYVSGAGSRPLRDQVRGWRRVGERTRPWSGGWLAVPAGNLGRTDRKQLAARSQALKLRGFAEAEPDLWVRPANLTARLRDLRAELVAIGLDDRAMLFELADYTAPDGVDFRALWDVEGLQARYAEALAAIETSAARIDSLPLAEAARETLSLGQAAIRLINLDPLLPEELVDSVLRASLVAAMQDYEARGQEIWGRYYREAG
jgi:phenylacetic acid degradation operon negative regulatory protein